MVRLLKLGQDATESPIVKEDRFVHPLKAHTEEQ